MAEEPPDLIQNVPAEWRRRWGVTFEQSARWERKAELHERFGCGSGRPRYRSRTPWWISTPVEIVNQIDYVT